MRAVKYLEQYALSNYDAGGHWIVETYTEEDYEAVLAAAGNDLNAAQTLLRDRWQLICEQEQNCAWGAPGEY